MKFSDQNLKAPPPSNLKQKYHIKSYSFWHYKNLQIISNEGPRVKKNCIFFGEEGFFFFFGRRLVNMKLNNRNNLGSPQIPLDEIKINFIKPRYKRKKLIQSKCRPPTSPPPFPIHLPPKSAKNKFFAHARSYRRSFDVFTLRGPVYFPFRIRKRKRRRKTTFEINLRFSVYFSNMLGVVFCIWKDPIQYKKILLEYVRKKGIIDKILLSFSYYWGFSISCIQYTGAEL